MALRVIRSLEYMKSRPEWDGKNLRVFGHSQGGFQSLLATAFDPQVTEVHANEPWQCDVSSSHRGRLVGFDPVYSPAIEYFDPVHLLKNARAYVEFEAGLADDVCPAGRITAAYNAVPGPRKIFFYQARNHSRDQSWAPVFSLSAEKPSSAPLSGFIPPPATRPSVINGRRYIPLRSCDVKFGRLYPAGDLETQAAMDRADSEETSADPALWLYASEVYGQ